MMKISCFLSLGAALFSMTLHARSAEGQQFSIPFPSPQGGEYRQDVQEIDRDRANTDDVAVCMIRYERDKVLSTLELGQTLEGLRAQRKLLNDRCALKDRAHISLLTYYDSLLRAKIIDAYSGKKFFNSGEAGPVDDEQPPIVVYTDNGGPRASGTADIVGEDQKETLPLVNFGPCVVRIDFEAARDFVIEPAGSPQENAALTRLSPILSQCSPEGWEARFTKNVLSQMLTEALYDRVAAAREVQPDA